VKPFLVAAACLAVTAACLAAPAPTRRPNIVFVLADDVGYMDVACYAARTKGVARSDCFCETPHIDRLADEGMLFTQAYATQLCSPSRAAILTGKFAPRLGFTTAAPRVPTYYNQKEEPPPGYNEHDMIIRGDLPDLPLRPGTTRLALAREEITFAEALKGFDTVFIGKWHVGEHGATGFQPTDQGFRAAPAYADGGASPYFRWHKGWNSTNPSHGGRVGRAGPANTGEQYLTDDLTVRACRYIRYQVSTHPDQPFLLYFCHFAVHGPFQAKKEDIDYFAAKTSKGWNGHGNPTYAAMMKSLDDSVGTVVQALRECGVYDDTAFIFMSDNGGVLKERGRTTVTSNLPFREGKATLYEGGIRVPLIVHWPKRIKTGTVCDVAVDCTDVFPTLMEMTATAQADYLRPGVGDGQSLVSLFDDPENEKNNYTKNTRYWHYPFYVRIARPPLIPSSAIRKGDWKLICDWHGKVELFNIPTDIGEKSNLAEKYPGRAKALRDELKQWLSKEVPPRYWPAPNPTFDVDKSPFKKPLHPPLPSREWNEERS